MHRRTAAFLATYAERGRDSRVRFPLTGIAARALAAGVRRGDREAAEAVWQAWLRHPGDETWDLLCGQRGAPGMTQAVFAAATDPARPATSRAALGAFCARRGLAPAAGSERALFYLLSGQSAQQRAADPDGSGLAAAYRAAGEPLRAAVRVAMASHGSADLLRVVAASGPDAVPASVTERDYLAAELARRRDWPPLWRLTLDLPLAEAAAAARLLPRDWPPGDEAARGLCGRLAEASPAAIAALAAAESVTPLSGGRTRRSVREPYIFDCRFAPDGSAIAQFTTVSAPPPGLGLYRDYMVIVRALPGGGELEAFRHTRLLLLLDRAVVYVEKHHPDLELRLVRRVRGHPPENLRSAPPGHQLPGLAPARDGFVVVGRDRLRYGTAVPGSPLRDVTPPGIGPPGQAYTIERVASEPRTGRLAVLIGLAGSLQRQVVVLSPDFEIIGRFAVPGTQQIAFCGPGRLVTFDGFRKVHSWRAGSPAAADAEAEAGSFGGNPRIQPLPSAGLILVGSRDCLDAQTLQPTAWPAALEWLREARGRLSVVSPDGGCAAAGDVDGDGEIRDLWQQEAGALLRTPMASSRLADLAAVARLADDFPARQPATAGALGLLRACLEYRFGAEVAIGTGPAAGAQDDIALAERDRTGR